MNAREVLESVTAGGELDEAAAEQIMNQILAGEHDAVWIAGFLVALRAKVESPAEIAGFARAMRNAATRVPCESADLVDTCGTGGDDSGSFNISTAAAFVVAGAGGRVAKHGNRSVSSQCGSADVLEALGAQLKLEPAQVGRCVDEVGFGFLYAPALHGAMRHAVEPRRSLGIRTVFNILGPLSNPAGASHQLIGVYSPELLDKLAEVLVRLGTARTILVHGDDGLDELSISGPSSLVMVEVNSVRRMRVDPREYGLAIYPAADLRGGDATTNARIIRELMGGEPGACRDIVRLNAAAALWAGAMVADLEAGLVLATQAMDSGAALASLDRYVEFSRSLAQ